MKNRLSEHFDRSRDTTTPGCCPACRKRHAAERLHHEAEQVAEFVKRSSRELVKLCVPSVERLLRLSDADAQAAWGDLNELAELAEECDNGFPWFLNFDPAAVGIDDLDSAPQRIAVELRLLASQLNDAADSMLTAGGEGGRR